MLTLKEFSQRTDGLKPSLSRELRAEFARQNVIQVPRFLNGEIFDLVQHLLSKTTFASRKYGVGAEQAPRDRRAASVLNFYMNDPCLFRQIRKITGGPEYRVFIGRVFKLNGQSKESFRWHSDNVEGRRVGLSLNLSPTVFEGGEFELRRAGTNASLLRIQNSGPGSALLFRISPELEHRVSPVSGQNAKITFSGWFVG